jgi:GNAT superfamily N-acetyltransferase
VIEIRQTRREDVRPIIRLSRDTYPESWSWGPGQLNSQLDHFPEGQLVAVDTEMETDTGGRIVGMAAAVMIRAADYPVLGDWPEMTDWGRFENHDATHGDTLYGAEIMVHPAYQGRGIGKMLYRAREDLARRLGVKAIRAGARISGYREYLEKHGETKPEEYVARVVAGQIGDPTLSFQLRRGFQVLGVIPDYFNDPASLDYAALIEWQVK